VMNSYIKNFVDLIIGCKDLKDFLTHLNMQIMKNTSIDYQ